MKEIKCKYQYKNKDVSDFHYKDGIAVYCKLAEQPCLAQVSWRTVGSHCGGNYNTVVFGSSGKRFKNNYFMEQCSGRSLRESTKEAQQFKENDRNAYAKRLEDVLTQEITEQRLKDCPQLKKHKIPESVLFEGGSGK